WRWEEVDSIPECAPEASLRSRTHRPPTLDLTSVPPMCLLCEVSITRSGLQAGESACTPGLDPRHTPPGLMDPELAVICGYNLSGSHHLLPDDSTMCPECARPDLDRAQGTHAAQEETGRLSP